MAAQQTLPIAPDAPATTEPADHEARTRALVPRMHEASRLCGEAWREHGTTSPEYNAALDRAMAVQREWDAAWAERLAAEGAAAEGAAEDAP